MPVTCLAITAPPLHTTCTSAGSAAASADRYGVDPCFWYSVGTTDSGASSGCGAISRFCTAATTAACAFAAATGPVPNLRRSAPQCHSS